MNSLEYSQEAEEAKGLFYNKNLTVYVEGDDDVMFWTHLFELAEVDAHIEEVLERMGTQLKIQCTPL